MGNHDTWVRPKTVFFDEVVRYGIKIDRFKEITEEEIYTYYPERKEISENKQTGGINNRKGTIYESYYATYQIVSFMNQHITQLNNVHLTTLRSGQYLNYWKGNWGGNRSGALFLSENKFKNGVMYIKSMYEFVIKYDMAESVEEESLTRKFQRWRKRMKKNWNNIKTFLAINIITTY